MFTRLLTMKLPGKQSAFLWGARQTGKSYFLKHYFKHSAYFDLLNTHDFIRWTKAPYLLREEILALSPEALSYPIIIDEIQKIPELLNEVHSLIENHQLQFILSHPENINDHFQAYVDVYLMDEIRNEGLVRNLAGFARFLDVVGLSNGEMINANNIARDCGVDRSTVKGFYQILVDTLLGYFVYPYAKKIKRDIVLSTPKFYLFDVGVANYLARQHLTGLRGAVAGKCLEHYILMELQAYIHLKRKRIDITYWRTKTGFEVDFVLGQANVALEVKISEQVHKEDLKGLVAFCEEHPKMTAMLCLSI